MLVVTVKKDNIKIFKVPPSKLNVILILLFDLILTRKFISLKFYLFMYSGLLY